VNGVQFPCSIKPNRGTPWHLDADCRPCPGPGIDAIRCRGNAALGIRHCRTIQIGFKGFGVGNIPEVCIGTRVYVVNNLSEFTTNS